MVKRKTNVNIDDWLGGGTSLPNTNEADTVTAEESPVMSNDPTAEVVAEPVPAGPVITPITNVAVSVEEEAHWFWALLEESGYERW